ncbi:hypothetical protein P3S68_015837 [Capsicum galapagoense]
MTREQLQGALAGNIINRYQPDELYIQNYTVIDRLDCTPIELSEIPIDYAFPKVSIPESDFEELQIQIYKDQDYYLQLHSMFVIGFWPETIFKALRNVSQTVRDGGKAHTPAGETVSPPMGNGQFWFSYPHKTCHMRQVLYGVGYNQEFNLINRWFKLINLGVTVKEMHIMNEMIIGIIISYLGVLVIVQMNILLVTQSKIKKLHHISSCNFMVL